jgi:hypothetical protein
MWLWMPRIKARRQVIEWTTEDRIGAEYMLSKPRNLITTKDASFLIPKEVMGTPLEAETIEFYQRIQEKVVCSRPALTFVVPFHVSNGQVWMCAWRRG